jgi:hypothetical protein
LFNCSEEILTIGSNIQKETTKLNVLRVKLFYHCMNLC